MTPQPVRDAGKRGPEGRLAAAVYSTATLSSSTTAVVSYRRTTSAASKTPAPGCSVLAAAQANTDEADRTLQFVEMQRLIMDEAPAVPLYQPKIDSMHTADLGGFYLHPVWIFSFPDYYFTTAQK